MTPLFWHKERDGIYRFLSCAHLGRITKGVATQSSSTIDTSDRMERGYALEIFALDVIPKMPRPSAVRIQSIDATM